MNSMHDLGLGENRRLKLKDSKSVAYALAAHAKYLDKNADQSIIPPEYQDREVFFYAKPERISSGMMFNRKALNLQNTVLDLADFSGADLRKAHFEGARLHDVNFTGCKLTLDFMRHAKFEGANLAHVEFYNTAGKRLGKLDADGNLYCRESSLEKVGRIFAL